MKNLLASLLLLGIATSAFAGRSPTPEIDGASAAGALTLIAGAALVLRARRSK